MPSPDLSSLRRQAGHPQNDGNLHVLNPCYAPQEASSWDKPEAWGGVLRLSGYTHHDGEGRGLPFTDLVHELGVLGFSTAEVHRAPKGSCARAVCVQWGWTVSAEAGRAALGVCTLPFLSPAR